MFEHSCFEYLSLFPKNVGTDIEDANEWEIIENNFPNPKLKKK
jgi:hypothetical protein